MTYTIMGRDKEHLGIATQSHYFALGNVVPWLRSDVGAVATQSFVDPSYGPLGLDRLRAGQPAEQALSELTGDDTARETRQVGFLPVDGPPAAFTGSNCIQPAGHIVGDDHIAMGNMLTAPTVWPAISAAFLSTSGTLAERLLASLEAGQEAGGDIRGMQASAIKVSRRRGTGQPWHDPVVDLRVDDHVDPVAEIRRLFHLSLAYVDIADVLFAPNLITGQGNASDEARAEAEAKLGSAIRALNGNQEARLWRAVLRAKYGDADGARSDAEVAFSHRPELRDFVGNLLRVGVVDNATYDLLAGAAAPPSPSLGSAL